jgi:hypothetical protein
MPWESPIRIARSRNKLKRNDTEDLHSMALSLCVETGINLTNRVTIEDIKKVQLNFRIVIGTDFGYR